MIVSNIRTILGEAGSLRFISPLTYRPDVYERRSTAERLECHPSDNAESTQNADLAEVFHFELNATQGPPRAANKSVYLPQNAYDYHTTLIGFVAAAETSPV
jgi:hypothetical protein